MLKLRENFEDKFRYDEEGVPRIWRPSDDIEGLYTKARESTLELIPLLSRFKLLSTSSPPPLDAWIGTPPQNITAADEEDLNPIGGVDEDEGKTLEEEMTILGDVKRQDLATRFKKTADGVYVEAKRSAIGGVAQVPLYFYGLLLALGWNEIVAGRDRTSPQNSALTISSTNTILSSPQPSLLRVPHSYGSWRLCDLHTQPLGTYTPHDQRGKFTRTGHFQGKAARLPRDHRHWQTSCWHVCEGFLQVSKRKVSDP